MRFNLGAASDPRCFSRDMKSRRKRNVRVLCFVHFFLFFLVGSAALFSRNIQQITILIARNESNEQMNAAKSCSLSDLRHEIFPRLSQEEKMPSDKQIEPQT